MNILIEDSNSRRSILNVNSAYLISISDGHVRMTYTTKDARTNTIDIAGKATVFINHADQQKQPSHAA